MLQASICFVPCGRVCDANVNAGPELGQRRVYLSPATLLVVPGTLIGHWEEQVPNAPLPLWFILLQRQFSIWRGKLRP